MVKLIALIVYFYAFAIPFEKELTKPVTTCPDPVNVNVSKTGTNEMTVYWTDPGPGVVDTRVRIYSSVYDSGNLFTDENIIVEDVTEGFLYDVEVQHRCSTSVSNTIIVEDNTI